MATLSSLTRRSFSVFFLDETHQHHIAAHLCHVAQGVPRELGGKAWHVFANTFNHVVQEIRWVDKLNPRNYCPHFPFFMTHFTDSMPIASISGVWSVDLWNPKYALHVFKVTVAVDMLGNIIWICPLAPGTSTNVLI